jgi:hypothetical protein
MKNVTKIMAAIVGLATLAAQLPGVQEAIGGVMSAHPNVAAIVGGIAAILALLHIPTPTE